MQGNPAFSYNLHKLEKKIIINMKELLNMKEIKVIKIDIYYNPKL